jgi:hypothetical protein
LWPLILVAIGLDLLLGRRNPAISVIIVLLVLAAGAGFLYANGGLQARGNLLSTDLSVPLNGAKSASVSIDFGAGDLKVDTLEGDNSKLAAGRLEYYQNSGRPVQTADSSGGKATLHLSQGKSGNNGSFPGFGPGGGLNWDVHLNPQVDLDMNVNTGAGHTNLDLEDLKVTQLTITIGAGGTEVVLPKAAGTTKAQVQSGAGGVQLDIPEGVEAHIQVKSGLGSVDVDERFKKKDNNTFESDNYASATNKVELDINAGVGSITVSSR